MTDSLLASLPCIHRAREYRLYTADGRRIVDMYLDDGLALCGHRATNFSRAIKNTLSRGLTAAYPGIYRARFFKILKAMFPTFGAFRVYTTESPLKDLSSSEDEKQQPRLWRPFHPDGVPSAEVLILHLPLQIRPAPRVVALGGPLAGALAGAPDQNGGFPPSDLISPFLYAAYLENLTTLNRMKAIYNEESWRLWDKPGWRRVGPYLYPPCTAEEYPGFFQSYLEAGFLLNPVFQRPSIIPASYSENELERFLKQEEPL